MTPEERQQLKNEIKQEIMNDLGNFSAIPLNVEQALSKRLGLETVPTTGTSVVDVATFTQTVDEAGAGTYDVAKVMTGFTSLILPNGTIKTVATYD